MALIDKQQAIDVIRAMQTYKLFAGDDLILVDQAGVMTELMMLPSAQTEPTTEIQEILNYLDTTLHPIVSPDNWNVYAELHDMISKLPSAQPERKTGHWVDNDEAYECSVCGSLFYIEDGTGDMNFCPNCGAKMEGGIE